MGKGERRRFPVYAMAPRAGALLEVLGTFFFRFVGFDETAVERIRALTERGPVVLVMHRFSVLDWMYLNWAFLQRRLPLVAVTPGLSLRHAFLVYPLYQMVGLVLALLFRRRVLDRDWRTGLRDALRAGRPVLVFIRRDPFLAGARPVWNDEILDEIVAAHRELGVDPTFLPQLLVWRRDPERHHRSLRTLVFGAPDAPGRFRKLLSFLLNFRRAFVAHCEPFSLSEALQSSARDDTHASEAAALRWRLMQALRAEGRVFRGPIFKRARQMRDEVLRNPDLVRQLEDVARTQGRRLDDVHREARRILREMAGDLHIGWIEFIALVLTFVWDRVYDEVVEDEEGLERLRAAGRRAPLALTPSHRSHVDYLIVSYLLYNHGLLPPMIAGGNNLNFFPLGTIFRHAGAFFIRRHFRDDPVYRLVFRYYVRKLVKEGYWVEFFPEGGRSRTGKLLPPRLGLLYELLLAVREGVVPDVRFCPIAITYEKIIEERSMARELAGADKKPETFGAVLRATRVLAHRYGRLGVRFGPPLSAADALASLPPGAGEEAMRTETKRFAYAILHGINRESLVTPSALVALALLAREGTGLTRNQLLHRVGFLAVYLERHRGARLSTTLTAALDAVREHLSAPPGVTPLPAAVVEGLASGPLVHASLVASRVLGDIVDETLRMFGEGRLVALRDYGDDLVIEVPADARLTLDYYKNTGIHWIATAGILALALGPVDVGDRCDPAAVRECAAWLSRLFRLEFVYDPARSFAEAYAAEVTHFERMGWLRADASGAWTIGPDAIEALRLLARSVRSVAEGYWLAAVNLPDGARRNMSEAQWIRYVQQRAEELLRDGRLTLPEARSRALLQLALQAWALEGGVVLEATRRGRCRLGGDESAWAVARQGAEQLERLLQPPRSGVHAHAQRVRGAS